jgi:glutathione peroxidase-family protein
MKDAEANEQQKSIIGALRVAAPKWEFEQIKFVVGNRGSVVESNFYTKLTNLHVQGGKKDRSSPIM